MLHSSQPLPFHVTVIVQSSTIIVQSSALGNRCNQLTNCDNWHWRGWSWLENYTHWHPKHKMFHQLACKQLKFVFITLVSMTISSLFNLDTEAYRICADMNVVGTNSSLSNLLICLTLKTQVVNIVLNSIVLQKCNCEGFAAVMLGWRPQLPNTLMSHHFLLISSLFSPKHFLVYINAVNYRGSAGFGQDMVEGLCGKVGDQDVKDVQVSS